MVSPSEHVALEREHRRPRSTVKEVNVTLLPQETKSTLESENFKETHEDDAVTESYLC